jgi:hypothetical protein
MCGTATYRVWRHMHTRCENPKCDDFKDYGGRGISVCERWQKFEHFYADMGRKPDNHSIDRIDTNGNYEPGNCRWASLTEQANNKRSNVLIEHAGKALTLPAWARELGLNYCSLYTRYQRGERPPRLLRPIGADAKPRPRGLIYKNSKKTQTATVCGGLPE